MLNESPKFGENPGYEKVGGVEDRKLGPALTEVVSHKKEYAKESLKMDLEYGRNHELELQKEVEELREKLNKAEEELAAKKEKIVEVSGQLARLESGEVKQFKTSEESEKSIREWVDHCGTRLKEMKLNDFKNYYEENLRGLMKRYILALAGLPEYSSPVENPATFEALFKEIGEDPEKFYEELRREKEYLESHHDVQIERLANWLIFATRSMRDETDQLFVQRLKDKLDSGKTFDNNDFQKVVDELPKFDKGRLVHGLPPFAPGLGKTWTPEDYTKLAERVKDYRGSGMIFNPKHFDDWGL
ncbi:MAG: hypothetical protein HY225_04195 [Candidatus Vogelbacteria bacterium]|nr:hypothetical protein [Candidatus Vogelbacteria bacterium]